MSKLHKFDPNNIPPKGWYWITTNFDPDNAYPGFLLQTGDFIPGGLGDASSHGIDKDSILLISEPLNRPNP